LYRSKLGDQAQLLSTKEMNTASNTEKYYVYANLNCVYDEDFTFIFTALFEWEKQYPTFKENLITNPEDLAREKQPEPDKPKSPPKCKKRCG